MHKEIPSRRPSFLVMFVLLAALVPGCEDPHQILTDNPHDPLSPAYVPIVPAGIRITNAGETSRVVSWNPTNTYVVRYMVERKLGSAGLYESLGSVTAPETSFTDTTTVMTDTMYYYRVSSVAMNGNASLSLPVSFSLAFAPPSDLHTTCVSTSSVMLRWSNNSPLAKGFQVESSLNGATYTLLARVPSDSLQWRASGLSAGNVYRFRVEAVSQRNVSAPSAVVALRSVSQPFEMIWSAQTDAPGDLSALAFSPDGTTLASGGGADIQLWRTDTGQRSGVLSHQAGSTEWEVAFAPGGATLAASHGTHIDLFDLASQRLDRTLSWPGIGWGQSLSFDREGKILVCGSDSVLAVLDPVTGSLLRLFTSVHRFVCSRLNPDGLTVAAGSPTTPLTFYRVADGSVSSSIPQQSTVKQLGYSPDGSLIAAADAVDATVRIWSAASGTLYRELPGLTNGWSVAFSPDGKWVAASDQLVAVIPVIHTSGEARIWNVSDGSLVAAFPGNPSTGAVAFSPYGNLVAVGKASAVDLWAAAGTWVLAP